MYVFAVYSKGLEELLSGIRSKGNWLVRKWNKGNWKLVEKNGEWSESSLVTFDEEVSESKA